MQFQPAVFVARDGRSATARWRDHAMLGQYKKHAEWRDGVYENSYVREGGVWKIKSLHLYVNFVAPYEKAGRDSGRARGWCRVRRRSRSRPDRGPTVSYKPFPETQVPPFQAPNPVTGRPVVVKSVGGAK